jgi:hypothetical protein
MSVALLPHETVALAAICKALRGSNLQVRQPSYNYPSFWSRPIYKTNYLAVPPNAPWRTLVLVTGLPQYVGILRQFVATSLGSVALTGLRFRFLVNGQPDSNIQLLPGVEYNKDGGNSYPIIPRNFFLPVNETQRVEIQVENPTNVQQIAIGLLAGWYMDSMDSTVTANSNAMVDGVYTPFVGVTYGN